MKWERDYLGRYASGPYTIRNCGALGWRCWFTPWGRWENSEVLEVIDNGFGSRTLKEAKEIVLARSEGRLGFDQWGIPRIEVSK